jgi:hypothetical protein
MSEFSPQTCRAARALIGWTAADLAARAEIGIATVKRFELGGDVRRSSAEAMRNALRDADVVFIEKDTASPNGGPGVRLRS